MGSSPEVRTLGGGRLIEVPVLGLKTVSEQNMRENWRARARRTKYQKQTVLLVLGTHPSARTAMQYAPLRVTMTRVSPGPGLDSDGAVASQKHVRDAVAKVLGVDDGDARVSWHVQQRKGPWAVEIRIEASDGNG